MSHYATAHSAKAAGPVVVGTLDVRAQVFDVSVDMSQGGHFRTQFEETAIYADTLEALREKLMAATRKAAVKLDKRIVGIEGQGARYGTIVGIHGGNGNLMVHRDNHNRPQQESGLYNALDADKITADQVARLDAIFKAITALNAEEYAIRKDAKFDKAAFLREHQVS